MSGQVCRRPPSSTIFASSCNHAAKLEQRHSTVHQAVLQMTRGHPPARGREWTWHDYRSREDSYSGQQTQGQHCTEPDDEDQSDNDI
eukprot:3315998-Amphidinium_carterae.1